MRRSQRNWRAAQTARWISRPPRPDEIERVLQFFWMSQQKNQKVLFRGLPLGAWQGVYLMRQDLMRFWYRLGNRDRLRAFATVDDPYPDPGHPGGASAARCGCALALVGQPTRTAEEIIAEANRLADAVASAGRLLAEQARLSTYSAAAEETVRSSWISYVRDCVRA